MSDFISLSQAFAQWQELTRDDHRLNPADGPMLAESWNNYTDSLAKDGQLSPLQYHYAPAYDDDMPGEGSRYDALSDDREFILTAMGVTMVTTFVPWRESRNKGDDRPSLNWKITVKYGSAVIAEGVDYMQGSGHCPADKRAFNTPTMNPDREKRAAIEEECATGYATVGGIRGGTFKRGAKLEPDLTDVMHSLITDGGAIDSRDFSDWASDYGYDTDSIKARETYDACVTIGLRLRAAFGGERFEQLRELFEGM